MTAIPIQLIGPLGEPMGTLRIGADTLIAKAEETARSRNLTKRTALPLVLREYLAGAGYAVGERELSAAVEALEKIRRGEYYLWFRFKSTSRVITTQTAFLGTITGIIQEERLILW